MEPNAVVVYNASDMIWLQIMQFLLEYGPGIIIWDLKRAIITFGISFCWLTYQKKVNKIYQDIKINDVFLFNMIGIFWMFILAYSLDFIQRIFRKW